MSSNPSQGPGPPQQPGPGSDPFEGDEASPPRGDPGSGNDSPLDEDDEDGGGGDTLPHPGTGPQGS